MYNFVHYVVLCVLNMCILSYIIDDVLYMVHVYKITCVCIRLYMYMYICVY